MWVGHNFTATCQESTTAKYRLSLISTAVTFCTPVPCPHVFSMWDFDSGVNLCWAATQIQNEIDKQSTNVVNNRILPPPIRWYAWATSSAGALDSTQTYGGLTIYVKTSRATLPAWLLSVTPRVLLSQCGGYGVGHASILCTYDVNVTNTCFIPVFLDLKIDTSNIECHSLALHEDSM